MSEGSVSLEAQARAPANSRDAFGAGACVGMLIWGVVAIVPALRAGVVSWTVLFGSGALLVAPLAGALRPLRLLSKGTARILVASALALPVLTLFSRILKVSTHHRPLGGVTYSLISAIVLLGCLAVAARLLAWATTRARAISVRAGTALLACLSLPLVAPLFAPGMGVHVLDGVLLIAAALAGGLIPVSESLARPLGRAAPIVLAVALLGSILAQHGLKGAAQAARNAPVAHGVVGVLFR